MDATGVAISTAAAATMNRKTRLAVMASGTACPIQRENRSSLVRVIRGRKFKRCELNRAQQFPWRHLRSRNNRGDLRAWQFPHSCQAFAPLEVQSDLALEISLDRRTTGDRASLRRDLTKRCVADREVRSRELG